MKHTLKHFFVAAVMLLSVSVFAQDKATEGAKIVTANMKEQLTLNDSQYTKVLEINKSFLQKALDIKATTVTKAEKVKKLRVINDERETKLKSVLTDDQYKIYAANRAANRQKLREHYMEKHESE